MIYVDTSVVLAQLLAEDRLPPAELWTRLLVSSRLLEVEVWNRVHARQLAESHGEATQLIVARLAFLELSRPVLARASQPFPVGVRTLDALHLATIELLRREGHSPSLASYDLRMIEAAGALGIPLYDLS